MREQARIRLIQSLAEYVLSIQAAPDASEEGEALFEAGVVGDETVYPSLAKPGQEVVASPWDSKS